MPPGGTILIGPEYEENLALRYLAAAVQRSGRRATLRSLPQSRDIEPCAREIAEAAPRLVGLSMTFQAGLETICRLAAALRSAGYRGHLTCGGQFATVAAPRLLEAIPALDSVARGDGEETLVEMLQCLEAGRNLGTVRGLLLRDPAGAGAIVETPVRPAAPDLGSIARPLRTPPFPRQAGLPLAAMLGSRGCMQGCTYCSIQTYGRSRPGPRQRLREVADIVDEMADLYARYGVRIFVFHDDNFLCPDVERSLQRAEEYRREIARRHLVEASLVIKIRPDVVTHDLVLTLKEAGLVRAYVGIESGNAHGLKVLGRGCRPEDNRRALRIFEGCGVFACYNLLVFHPETTLEDILVDVAFARSHPATSFNVGRVEIYAGTPLDRWLRRQGRLLGPEFAPYYRIRDRRAETASRLFTLLFHRRAFHLEGVLNTVASLGYEPAARRRAGHAVGRTVDADLEALTRAVNADSLDRLEATAVLAGTLVDDPRALQERAADLAWETAVADLEFEARARTLRRRLQRPTSLMETMA